MSPSLDHKLTPSTAYTQYSIQQVQHTPSTAYTEYSIHRVQHTPSAAYTEYSIHRVLHQPSFVSLPFIVTITSWPWNVASASHVPPLYDRPPPATSPWELKRKVSLLHSHHCELTNWWIALQHPAHLLSTPSKYSFTLARSWLPSASSSSLDYILQVHLWVHSIRASKCICNFARLRPPSSSSNSLDRGLQLHLQAVSITGTKCNSEFTWSGPPSASPNSLDYGLQVHLWVYLIRASQCITKLARSRPPSASLSSPNNRLQVHLWVHSIIIVRRTLIFSQAPPAASQDIPSVDV